MRNKTRRNELAETSRRFREALRSRYEQLCRGILHLGAHVGQEAPRYDALGKPALWIEAMPDIHERLAERLKSFPGQLSLCALLGDTDGATRTFHVSSNAEGVSSSLFRFGPHASALWPHLGLKMVRKLSLPMTRLDTLLDQQRIDPATYDYWVADLQGAEKLALAGAPRALGHCRALLVETSTHPVYEQGVLWPELRDFLVSAGFTAMWEPELDHDDVLFVRVAAKARARKEFGSESYLRHNRARLDHAASLQLDLRNKTVLETGAGIGDHTVFYLERNCSVVSTDIRPENLALLRERFSGHPRVAVRALDLDHPLELGRTFDIVHCYGTLYHLERPGPALEFIARHCGGLLLLETCVSTGEGLDIRPVPEPAHRWSQAFYGQGCRPTRGWIWETLKSLFPFVYATRTQPDHEEFPIDWTDATAAGPSGLKRAVFVASRRDLGANPELLDTLPATHPRRAGM